MTAPGTASIVDANEAPSSSRSSGRQVTSSEHGAPGEPPSEPRQRLAGGVIGPLEVLGDDESRHGSVDERDKSRCDCLEQPHPRALLVNLLVNLLVAQRRARAIAKQLASDHVGQRDQPTHLAQRAGR